MVLWLVSILVALPWFSPVQLVATGSTGLVYNVDRDARGTSVAIGRRDRDVYFLTAEHVVAGGRLLKHRHQTQAGPSAYVQDVQVVLASRSLDLALLRVANADNPPPLASPRLRPIEPSEEFPFPAWSVGVSASGKVELREERVLGKRLLRLPHGDERFAWECQQPAVPGNSGGGLFDQKGRLIGICSGRHEGKGYYTHVDEIRHWLRRSPYGWILTESAAKPAK